MLRDLRDLFKPLYSRPYESLVICSQDAVDGKLPLLIQLDMIDWPALLSLLRIQNKILEGHFLRPQLGNGPIAFPASLRKANFANKSVTGRPPVATASKTHTRNPVSQLPPSHDSLGARPNERTNERTTPLTCCVPIDRRFRRAPFLGMHVARRVGFRLVGQIRAK